MMGDFDFLTIYGQGGAHANMRFTLTFLFNLNLKKQVDFLLILCIFNLEILNRLFNSFFETL